MVVGGGAIFVDCAILPIYRDLICNFLYIYNYIKILSILFINKSGQSLKQIFRKKGIENYPESGTIMYKRALNTILSRKQ